MRERRESGPSEPAAGPIPIGRPEGAPFDEFPRLAGPVAEGASDGLRARLTDRRTLLAAAAVGVGLLLVGGFHLAGLAASWLGDRPTYTLAFDRIELLPDPPPSIKPGRGEILRRVRDRAGRPHEISVLGLDAEELAREFGKHSPWIEQVTAVRTAYPNRLTVEVVFREPVAFTIAENGSPIYLDRNGYVLPGDEIDRKQIPSIVLIQGLSGPPETRPGLRVTPPSDPEAERWTVAATRLAGFFHDRAAEARGHRAPPIRWIFVQPEGLGLLAGLGLDGDNEVDLWLAWGAPPGDEPAGRPTAEQKWARFLEWAARPDRPEPRPPSLLEFGPEGVRVRSARGPSG